MTDDRIDQEQGAGVEKSTTEVPLADGAPRVTDKRRVHDPFTGEKVAVAEEAPAADAATADETQDAHALAAQYLDDLKRLKAEFENYRKRVVREQTALAETAAAALVEQLLPVLDDFELALIAADRTKDYTALVRGVELVFSKLTEVLQKQGLKRIEAEGLPFDPELHEAVMQEEGSDEGKPVVAEVFRSGYTLGRRIIRPAMVKVKRQT